MFDTSEQIGAICLITAQNEFYKDVQKLGGGRDTVTYSYLER